MKPTFLLQITKVALLLLPRNRLTLTKRDILACNVPTKIAWKKPYLFLIRLRALKETIYMLKLKGVRLNRELEAVGQKQGLIKQFK